MVLNLLRRHRMNEPACGAWLPRGIRIYAIGDIHGRADLLTSLLDEIRRDAGRNPGYTDYLIYLGDYVDRGLQSRQVLDLVSAPPPPGFGTIHLRGNHEQAMLDFLEDETAGANWLHFGGVQTLFSYDIHLPERGVDAMVLAEARRRLAAALPPAHLSFLTHLRYAMAIGGYFFVHAGIRPGVPLDRQAPEDMLWIREEFLSSRVDHGKIVVHGHTITDEPDIRPNRIGIDTGAYASGHLTCLVLEEDRQRFLST